MVIITIIRDAIIIIIINIKSVLSSSVGGQTETCYQVALDGH